MTTLDKILAIVQADEAPARKFMDPAGNLYDRNGTQIGNAPSQPGNERPATAVALAEAIAEFFEMATEAEAEKAIGFLFEVTRNLSAQITAQMAPAAASPVPPFDPPEQTTEPTPEPDPGSECSADSATERKE